MTADLKIVLRRNLAAALEAKRFEDAESILARLEAEDPLSVETGAMRLEFLVKSNMIAEARTLATALVQQFPESGRVLFFAGRAAFAMRAYADAERFFRESDRLAHHAFTRRWLGRTLRQAGRLDEAEAILTELSASHPECEADLAWLYEKKKDRGRALEMWRKLAARNPSDKTAARELQRLNAQTHGPRALADDYDARTELGDELPDHLLAVYVEALFAVGRGPEARALVERERPGLDARTCVNLAWAVRRHQAFDLSYGLFADVLRGNLANSMLLNSIEHDAQKCGRTRDLLELYRALASESPNLFGRIKRLERKLDTA